MKKAFTLAEVLVTLGIIGIIAAITIPNVLGNYKKRHVETSLAKFYSEFNQALKLGENENGSISTWRNVDIAYNGDSMKIWWDKYLSKYYKTIDYKIKNNWLILAGSDGSGIGLMSCKDYEFANSCIHVIYCVNYNKCVKDEFNITPEWGAPTNGKNSFAFYINSGGLNTLDYKVLGKREEHIYETAKISKNFSCGSEDKYAKNSYCSGLIRMDGWKISKDYPIKF